MTTSGARASTAAASRVIGTGFSWRRDARTAIRAWVLAAAAVAVGEGNAAATDWTSFGRGGTGAHATTEVLGARFTPLWTSAISTTRAEPVYRALLASPAVADGYIAVATYGNRVQVLREQDGAAL